ncbi:DUF2071 domain-containing protein [Haloarcula argentinensis]|uniref:DUF2071 domain-containing protein n=1 Tax=Haloarcula argentinensis TaxID=43776 RepID=A0A830FJ41_HALAR|nr:DUF2071 domain-containing protein [Haloarcula argentinensis]EMA23400.1 hypothetical protein C443_07038 [Haloarcula argentinensis DSM 12282]MDS0252993.1 DUF2071 domain-containing protein [Haloarcula argentinensis]GGM27916.1 hypothetical protein GCM10009006_06760 [Haloarcula argentinensis]
MVALRPLQVTLDDVCFCHWPVSEAAVQVAVPDWLTVETADDDAWVSAVTATVDRVETFGIEVAGPSELLTVRTYVRGPTGQRGVCVLGLFGDDRRTATAVSELFRITVGDAVPRTLPTADRRRVLDAGERRLFECRYTVSGGRAAIPPDSLASFLVDRQRYFTTGRFGTHLVGSVGHDPWRLDRVDATVTGSVLPLVDISAREAEPLVHHSPGLRVSIAPPVPP